MADFSVQSSEKAIGVFDSGLGGLTCVSELMKLMPSENIIYFGDTARVPYGTRSKETILEYARQDVNFIKSFDVKMIIAACGTVSSVVGKQKDFAGDVPFTGVVIPAVQAACAATRNGRIGVIGTAATIRSGAYGKAIRNIRQDAVVIGNACTMFVPMVENGITDKNDIVVKEMIKRYLEPIRRENVDVLILGCTHYPILHEAIAEYMGEDVRLISSGAEAAKFTMNMLAGKNMLSERTESGKVSYYTSDSKELFEANAHAFIGSRLMGEVTQISIDDIIQK
ncbi:MAG: glutamate racemase [Oscillospiraceae bacterium]|nr:glutamate racemase [Oscillospiraceae bacterium]